MKFEYKATIMALPCCVNNFGKGRSFAEYLHLLVKPIVENKGVGDTESVGFHRVQLPIVEISNLQQLRFEKVEKKSRSKSLTSGS